MSSFALSPSPWPFRRVPVRVLLATTAVCVVAAISAGPAHATTWTSHTDCDPWWYVPSTSVCLHAGDWYNTYQAGNSWEWPECHSWTPLYACGENHMGHYTSYGVNVDWLHYRIDSGIGIPWTTWTIGTCVILNIMQASHGTMWENNSSHPVGPGMGC